MPWYRAELAERASQTVMVWAESLDEALTRIQNGPEIRVGEPRPRGKDLNYEEDPDVLLEDFSDEEYEKALAGDPNRLLALRAIAVQQKPEQAPPLGKLVCPECGSLGPFNLIDKAYTSRRIVAYEPADGEAAATLYVMEESKVLDDYDERYILCGCACQFSPPFSAPWGVDVRYDTAMPSDEKFLLP